MQGISLPFILSILKWPYDIRVRSVIRTYTADLSKWLLVLLVLQHALAAAAVAAPDSERHSGATAEVSGHCESMPSEQSGEQDVRLNDHQDCVESGCDECVGCAACLPLAEGVSLEVSGQTGLFSKLLFFPEPYTDFLYRPPIHS
jgi:hypothetical protein